MARGLFDVLGGGGIPTTITVDTPDPRAPSPTGLGFITVRGGGPLALGGFIDFHDAPFSGDGVITVTRKVYADDVEVSTASAMQVTAEILGAKAIVFENYATSTATAGSVGPVLSKALVVPPPPTPPQTPPALSADGTILEL